MKRLLTGQTIGTTSSALGQEKTLLLSHRRHHLLLLGSISTISSSSSSSSALVSTISSATAYLPPLRRHQQPPPRCVCSRSLALAGSRFCMLLCLLVSLFSASKQMSYMCNHKLHLYFSLVSLPRPTNTTTACTKNFNVIDVQLQTPFVFLVNLWSKFHWIWSLFGQVFVPSLSHVVRSVGISDQTLKVLMTGIPSRKFK
jgi:hypothetical protein